MPVTESASALKRQMDETIQSIAARTTFRPTVGLIVGSGLGGLTDALQVEAEFPYTELPHMPPSTAPGHEGKLVLGTLPAASGATGGAGESQRLAVMAGRFHFYEGYTMPQVVYPVRLMQALGAKILILTSIVGSMHKTMPPGSLVLLEDHINLMSENPLRGTNDETLGPRFPDMSEPYDPALRAHAREVASAQGIPLQEGVYVAVNGPNLETRAEYRLLRQVGAHVVGMSVVPEVIAARHGGLRVMAVTVVSDACIPEELKPATVEELLRVAAATEPKLTSLIQGVIARL